MTTEVDGTGVLAINIAYQTSVRGDLSYTLPLMKTSAAAT
jgi:hypothetical protein